MPVQNCQRNGMPGFKWGKQGHCYTYQSKDEAGRRRARTQAEAQGRAIEAAGGEKKKIEESVEVKKAEK